MIEINKLKRKIEKHSDTIKVVSFDVFDTLLIRLIPTERVSSLAAENLSICLEEEIGKVIRPHDILHHRFSYQHKVRKKLPKREWSLSEWLYDLAEEVNVDREALKDIGCKAELDAEEKSLRLAEHSLSAVELVKGYGLKTIALSDMWLNQELLKKLLHRFNLFFDMVISSSTLVYSKKNGGIFRDVEEQLGIKSKAILHIGNKLGADYLMPRFYGWRAIWIPKWHFLIKMNFPPRLRKGWLEGNTSEEIIQSLEVPIHKIEANPFYSLAYNYLAPMLIIFSIVQWRRFRSQGIDTVLYIARDAHLMLHAYELIADLFPSSPQRYYIRLSRRVAAIAHPDNLLLNVKPLAGKVGKRTVGEWLNNFEIGKELFEEILKDSGLKEQAPFGYYERKRLRETCKRLQSSIEACQKEHISLIEEYIKSRAVDSSLERIGIIDTGWACTIQDTIRRVLNKAQLVSGIYLGVSAQGKRPGPHNLKYGLLRDDFRHASHLNPIEATAGIIRMWDTLLREPASSVKRLVREENNRVEPELEVGETKGTYDKVAAGMTRRGLTDGINARKKGVVLLIRLAEEINEKDFEIAAKILAKKISTKPEKKVATAILKLSFDEGTAKGEMGNLGFGGILKGVAWYSGLLSHIGLVSLCPILEVVASVLLKIKMQAGDRKNF